MAKKINSKDVFILNEPAVVIKNGNTLQSVRVGPKAFPIRVQREKINRLLIMHDLHTDPKVGLTEKDIPMLKLIAFEGTLSNNIPALRYNAILRLAAFPTIDTLNSLSYLADHGEDHFIRSHALLALGKSGIAMATPVIARSVNSKNILISNTAQKALAAMVNSLGVERVQAYFKAGSGLSYQILERTLQNMNKRKTKKRNQTKA